MRWSTILGLLLCMTASLPAQGKRKTEDGKPPEVDPYTDGDAERVREAGYVSIGRPLRLTLEQRSSLIEEVLGREWMLWAETEHFRIGSCLLSRYPPRGERDKVDRFQEEIARLRDKGLDIPRKVGEVDPWLTLHLFAQRLEDAYARFEDWMGVTERTFPPPPAEPPEIPVDRNTLGPYLGAQGKFVVLLFEQKADVARYASRFGKRQSDTSLRNYDSDEDTHIFATSRQPYTLSGAKEDSWFQCHVTGSMVRVFLSAFRGFRYNMPLWLTEGLAHYTTRKIDPTYFSPTVAEGQDADSRSDPEWEKKVYARVKHDYYPSSADLMVKGDPREFEFADHLMSWSRIDFLFQRKGAQPGRYMFQMKNVPSRTSITMAEVCANQESALEAGFGLDYAALDREWAAWVAREYHPRRLAKRKR